MKRRHQKKLSVHRETLRHLTPEHLEEAKAAAAAAIAKWSDPPACDPACTSQTLSCTL